MPQLDVTDRAGKSFAATGGDGSTVMEIIRDAGDQDNFACCGGHCSCATCHVYLEDGAFDLLPAMSLEENDLLDSSAHRRSNSRLSCQIKAEAGLDGARIIIAPED